MKYNVPDLSYILKEAKRGQDELGESFLKQDFPRLLMQYF